MPKDSQRRCSSQQFLRKCTCPARYARHVKWFFPPLRGSSKGIMHVKLMLLRFEGFVRIVISSLNLSDTQWSNAGDSFWWADLAFVSASSLTCAEESKVQAPIMDMLRNMSAPRGWIHLLCHCKWDSLQQAGTKVHAITSIPNLARSSVTYGMER
eukprot:TRINITY_DN102039_c0_g1_i1.p1 TRINITY_DN102039_c0_g1~~TRINITY_DN102039_c0_g1_i1.p1  ORF type:complete len:168 (-),score=19.46 TRINITY_DN102039_c0_g1_i1:415-879(-)